MLHALEVFMVCIMVGGTSNADGGTFAFECYDNPIAYSQSYHPTGTELRRSKWRRHHLRAKIVVR